MCDLNQKNIYITGGGSGMGLLASKKLAALGAHLLVFDLSPMESFLEQIVAARSGSEQRDANYQLNVADRDAVLATVANAAAEFGPPDVLINMAGIGGIAEFVAMKVEMFERIMQVNVYGSRNMVEIVLPLMLSRGQGQIMLVGSMGGSSRSSAIPLTAPPNSPWWASRSVCATSSSRAGSGWPVSAPGKSIRRGWPPSAPPPIWPQSR